MSRKPLHIVNGAEYDGIFQHLSQLTRKKTFEVTQNQLLGLIERLSGTKFEVTHLTTEEIRQQGVDHLEQGDYEYGYLEVVMAVPYGPWGFLGFGDQAEKWNSDLGLPKEDLEETVRQVLRKKDY
ncbi:hypothetical protein CDV55_105443 [Aspergillus turcosus]|nr:hypothetical protein CDV55_105443 [Aspergillus turcosus]